MRCAAPSAHNERWLPWLSERLRGVGAEADPERRAISSCPLSRRAAQERRRRFRVLAVARHPAARWRLWPAAHLRITIGTGEEMERVAAVLAEFMAGDERRLFERVALIGIGLIGSSLARVLRRDMPGHAHRCLRPPRRDPGRRCAASASPTRRPTTRPPR